MLASWARWTLNLQNAFLINFFIADCKPLARFSEELQATPLAFKTFGSFARQLVRVSKSPHRLRRASTRTHTHCQEFDKGMLLHVTTCYIMLHHHIITVNNRSKCVSSALLCWLLAMFPCAAMLGLLRCWDAEAERPSGEGRALALQCAPKMPGPGNPLVPHLVMSSSTL